MIRLYDIQQTKNQYVFIFKVCLLPDNQEHQHKPPSSDDLNDPNQLSFKLSLMPQKATTVLEKSGVGGGMGSVET